MTVDWLWLIPPVFYVVTVYPFIKYWQLVQQDLRDGVDGPISGIVVIGD